MLCGLRRILGGASHQSSLSTAQSPSFKFELPFFPALSSPPLPSAVSFLSYQELVFSMDRRIHPVPAAPPLLDSIVFVCLFLCFPPLNSEHLEGQGLYFLYLEHSDIYRCSITCSMNDDIFDQIPWNGEFWRSNHPRSLEKGGIQQKM